MPEPDVELPTAPSGRPPFRKIEGSLFLPEPVAKDVQMSPLSPPDEVAQSTHSPEEDEHLPSLGGGGGVTVSLHLS